MRITQKIAEMANLATLLRARGYKKIMVAPSEITGEPIITIHEKTGKTIIELYRVEIENEKRIWIERGNREFDWHYDNLTDLANIIAGVHLKLV